MSDEEQKQQFAIAIADIIQDLLQDSDELSDILEAAKEEGYDVLLTVFSGIMIQRRGERDGSDDEEEGETSAPLPIKFEFSDTDKKFLRSIGVQVPPEDDQEALPEDSDPELPDEPEDLSEPEM